EAARLPIAAPSANPSTSISPTRAEHVALAMGDRIDAIVDGGPTGFGIESAIVDVSQSKPRLLRHGAIGIDAIAKLVGTEDAASDVSIATERALSPGRQARHYAPRTPIRIVPAEDFDAIVLAERARGRHVAAIARGTTAVSGRTTIVLTDDPAAYA